jgi:hypothetical protein
MQVIDVDTDLVMRALCRIQRAKTETAVELRGDVESIQNCTTFKRVSTWRKLRPVARALA